MSIKQEAIAARLADPEAKTFNSSVPCRVCKSCIRYVSNCNCVECVKRQSMVHYLAADTKQNEFRLDNAVALFRSSGLGLCKCASHCGVSVSRLKSRLEQLGINPKKDRNKLLNKCQPRRYGEGSGAALTQVEFYEARTAIQTSRLFDSWYRSAHGQH